MKRLKDFVFIASGQSLREKIEHNLEGRFSIIQNKDMDKEIGLLKDKLSRINLPASSTPKLLSKNDIVLNTKFFRNSSPVSVVVDDEIGNLIAAPGMFVLTPINQNEINSYFINWYINSAKFGGHYFQSNATGSSILNITKLVLEEMPINLPSLEVQNKFLSLYRETLNEKLIFQKLVQKRMSLLDEVYNNFSSKGE
jgi:hypothetical protein